MTHAIVVVGSLHYDIMVNAPARPRKGETLTGQAWFPRFGGKGGNQALATAKAGANTRFVGAVGEDGFSDLMLATLQGNGIATDRIATIAGTGTGMSVALVDPEGDYGAVIVSGANLQIDTAQFEDAALWQDAKVLILQNEVPEVVNIAAARAARSADVQVCLNAAPARELSAALINLVDILVVNAVEAEDMGAGQVHNIASAEHAADKLLALVPLAIVTAGENGVAWAQRGHSPAHLAARPVTVISTHGAGDAFVGTLCHTIAEGLQLEHAIDAANKAAARHISKSQD